MKEEKRTHPATYRLAIPSMEQSRIFMQREERNISTFIPSRCERAVSHRAFLFFFFFQAHAFNPLRDHSTSSLSTCIYIAHVHVSLPIFFPRSPCPIDRFRPSCTACFRYGRTRNIEWPRVKGGAWEIWDLKYGIGERNIE